MAVADLASSRFMTKGADPRSRAALLAVAGLFALNGLACGAYAGVLPALRPQLGIDAGGLSVLLVCAGVCAVLGMQSGGGLAHRYGSRRVALSAVPLLVGGVVVIGFAPSLAVAAVGAGLFGAGNGLIDVAMNDLAVHVEQARGTPVMSRVHGFWSIGQTAGAALVYLVALTLDASGDPAGGTTSGAAADSTGGRIVLPSLLLAAVLVSAAAVAVYRPTPDNRAVIEPHRTEDPDGSTAASPRQTRRPKVAYLLAAMAVCFGLGEGSAMDWSAVHVTDVLGVDAGTGVLGLVAVATFMVAVRLAGDWFVVRLGRRRFVASGAVVSAAGYLVTVIGTSLPILLIGWALVGLGVGAIAPQIYAAAGHLGGARMLAFVLTFGYAAFLVGPGIMGVLVRHFGAAHAMVLPLALLGLLGVLTLWMPHVEDLAPVDNPTA